MRRVLAAGRKVDLKHDGFFSGYVERLLQQRRHGRILGKGDLSQ